MDLLGELLGQFRVDQVLDRPGRVAVGEVNQKDAANLLNATKRQWVLWIHFISNIKENTFFHGPKIIYIFVATRFLISRHNLSNNLNGKDLVTVCFSKIVI